MSFAPVSVQSGMAFDQIFNLCEGLLWLAIAAALMWRAPKNGLPRKLSVGAALSFALFGISDFIEVGTRAWYWPWPLLVLKAACVALLLAHLYLSRNDAVEKVPPIRK